MVNLEECAGLVQEWAIKDSSMWDNDAKAAFEGLGGNALILRLLAVRVNAERFLRIALDKDPSLRLKLNDMEGFVDFVCDNSLRFEIGKVDKDVK